MECDTLIQDTDRITPMLPSGQDAVHSQRTRVLIFSPDPELARSLTLLLENRFEVQCETKLENLSKRICMMSPHLLLIDLYSFPSDILRQLVALKKCRVAVPLIFLRGYLQLNSEIEEIIRSFTRWVFYKPLNADLLYQAIDESLAAREP